MGLVHGGYWGNTSRLRTPLWHVTLTLGLYGLLDLQGLFFEDSLTPRPRGWAGCRQGQHGGPSSTGAIRKVIVMPIHELAMTWGHEGMDIRMFTEAFSVGTNI